MQEEKNFKRYYKFFAYLLLFILVNLAGATLFFRIDLTKDGLYSISDVSKKVVSTLTEPLTIHVFFTRNLPAPYNNIERYLHDLLTEYSIYSNRYFNYKFHDVSVRDQSSDPATESNQQLANNYGIYPVQIQNIEKDEVKFQKAYMGMAMIHGDIVEKIPTITSTEGLEYQITTAIEKLNNKISALLRLKEKIQVKGFLSSSLEIVAPYLNLSGLSEMPSEIEKLVNRLSVKNYGKLQFAHYDPTRDSQAMEVQKKYNLFRLQWESQTDRLGKEIPAGTGIAGLVMEYDGKTQEIQLIQAVNVPIFGTQYKLTEMDQIETMLDEGIENLISIHEGIGYLSDHQTLTLWGGYGMPQQQPADSISNFSNLVSGNYSIKQINLSEDPLPENLNCLIIAGPKEEFSDHELFQIDQFLMKGKSMAIFLDAFNEIQPPQQDQQYFNRNQGPFYIPLKTGLEKLLKHYGITLKSSYLMDENCYRQRVDQRYGGGEQPIYFAPVISNRMINDQPGFMKNIERLIMVKISPLELIEEQIKTHEIDATRLFSSSEKSWEMSGRINLNPYFIQPPEKPESVKSRPLAFLLEGRFPSYFDGREIPEKPVRKQGDETAEAEGLKQTEKPAETVQEPVIDLSKVKKQENLIKKGEPGKILIIGATEILKNNLLDEEGKSPNAIFLLNALDYLNNREDIARIRSKQQRINLLHETKAGTKTLHKTFNIIGLPVLVIIGGILVWARRKSRKRKIQLTFKK